MKKGSSPWALKVVEAFGPAAPPVYRQERQDYELTVHPASNALWLIARTQRGSGFAFRPLYSADELVVKSKKAVTDGVLFKLENTAGWFSVKITFPDPGQPLFRYRITLKPKRSLLMPFSPRDLIPVNEKGNPEKTDGKVHLSQVGARSGLIYLSMTAPESGSLLYFQNLTDLSDYCEQTHTSVAGTVAGNWPELGFALPPTGDIPLSARKEVVISDAFVLLTPEIPKNEFAMAKQFLNLLAGIYLYLPVPKTKYADWPSIVEKTLHDLHTCHGCWKHIQGFSYLSAYACDYSTPPESMVQLAVLLPVMEYEKWSNRSLPVVQKIRAVIPNFFDEKTKCLGRWLPQTEQSLDRSEEHKIPRVMDSWYLFHPLLNVSRLAIAGDEEARQLFLTSLDYAIKIARHFNYEWPVFYNLDTLEVVKAESKPGEGGETDVAGLYANVLLQAWELTREKRYLQEAEKAAKSLQGKGFSLLYQANNTAFSAKAMIRLWKETKEERYLDLCYLCLANLFKNVWLWDCNYGYGKSFPTFFALFPLDEAPYTAVYEEHEVAAIFHDCLSLAGPDVLLPAAGLLMAEFVRFLTGRAAFYYPPLLPKEILSKSQISGELDYNLWMPLEDIHDGWEAFGEVGQEVYGAGLAFNIVTRQYLKAPDESFMIYVEFPPTEVVWKKKGGLSFYLWGAGEQTCRLRLMPLKGKLPPSFTVKGQQEYPGKRMKAGYVEYMIPGNQQITLNWKINAGKANNNGQTQKKVQPG